MEEYLWTEDGWEELAKDVRYNAKNLAVLCEVSPRQLQREFRRYFSRSPQAWLDEQRMIAAGFRLLAGEPLKSVASDLGFKQTSHFCRQFKSRYHMTPSEFVIRQVLRSEAATAWPCRPQITGVADR